MKKNEVSWGWIIGQFFWGIILSIPDKIKAVKADIKGVKNVYSPIGFHGTNENEKKPTPKNSKQQFPEQFRVKNAEKLKKQKEKVKEDDCQTRLPRANPGMKKALGKKSRTMR